MGLAASPTPTSTGALDGCCWTRTMPRGRPRRRPTRRRSRWTRPPTAPRCARPFTVSGWAINRTAISGTGVDAVQIYAAPSGGSATFLGTATYGAARSDIGALYGSQFTNSGWTLSNAGGSLAAGTYTVTAYAHNAAAGTFDATASATITVTVPPSNGLISVDSPTPGQVLTSAFEVGGWAIDAGAASGTGVDGVQFYVQPAGAAGAGRVRRHRQLRRGARRRRRRLRLAVHQLGLALHDHRPRPGQLHAGRLRAQHGDRQLQHRQAGAVLGQRQPADVDRRAVARSDRHRDDVLGGRLVDRSRRAAAAAPASTRCTCMPTRIRAAARRRSSSASPRSASTGRTSPRSTARSTRCRATS